MKRAAWIGGALLVLSLAAAAGFVREFSGDFHWHVVLGGHVLDELSLPARDVYSHTFAGREVYLSSWLADVLYALSFRGAGFPGAYLLRALALSAMAAFLLVEGRRRGLGPLAATALVTALLAAALFRFHLRPEIFAFALFAAVLFLLGEHERSGRARFLALAVALCLLWPNLHGSVSLGLAAIGIYAAFRVLAEVAARGRPRDRRLLTWCLAAPPAAFLLACVNPEGLSAPLAVEIVTEVCVTTIREWTPYPVASAPPLVRGAALAAVATTLLALALTRRTSYWHAALLAVLTVVTLRYQRFITYALLAAVPLLAINLTALAQALAEVPRARAWRFAGRGLAGLLLALSLAVLFADRELHREVGLGLDGTSRAFPERACRFVREAEMPGPLFNSYLFGNYLMYCLDWSHPVFIDGRAWSLYTDAFYARYRRAATSQKEFAALLADYPVTWAIVTYDPFASRLAAAPEDWRLVYFDDRALVYAEVRDSRLARIRAEHGFDLLDPSRLAQLARLPPSRLSQAEEELARQVRACRSCRTTMLASAAVAVAARDDAGFRRARDRLIERGEPPELPYLAAIHALNEGRPEAAAAHFSRWRERGGDPVIATIEQAKALSRAGRTESARALLAPERAPAGAAAAFARARRELVGSDSN